MNSSTIKIDTNRDCTITIKPCDRERDGQFIRNLTKKNCFDYLRNTIGWNEESHNREPKFSERYLMLFDGDFCIGFLSIREQPDCLYIETLQLVQQYRRQGIGTKMLYFAESIARKKSRNKIRLRVINGNPALALYLRNGFKTIKDQEWCVLMEKNLAA